MADLVFNAKFTPTSSSGTADPTEFDVVASIVEANSLFSAYDVAADDIVFLDTTSSSTAPYSVSKYKVIEVIQVLDAGTVEVTLKYVDTGSVVDPSEVLSVDGFISRPSPNLALSWISAPTVQILPDYLVQHARNNDMWSIVDNLTANAPQIYTNTYSGSTWSVNHNLGRKLSMVQVLDSDYNVMMPKDIIAVDNNNCTVEFPRVVEGYVICIG